MRRVSLFVSSAVAVVALVAFTGPAFAQKVDPSCDLSAPSEGDGIPGPYDNDPAIHESTIGTPDSQVQYEASGVVGSGLACGTRIWSPDGGQGSIYDNAKVRVAPGVSINSTAGIANGRFVGVARVNVASHGFFAEPHIFGVPPDDLDGPPEGINSWLRIDSIANCAAENPVGGDVPGPIVACYKGANLVGFNYNWVTDGDDGRFWLTIGPLHFLFGKPAGLTRIHTFSLCGYVGATGGTEQQYPAACGDSSQPWLQRNGRAGGLDCSGGNGIYTAKATMRDGTTTPEATTCVAWVGPGGGCDVPDMQGPTGAKVGRLIGRAHTVPCM